MLFNIVDPESGVTILFNIVDNCEQCGQQNIVQSYFHQLLKQPVLIVFNRVLSLHGLFYLYKNFDITFLTICLSWHTLSTSPVGRKPEHPEKTHDFRQSVFGRALTDSFHMSPWRESDPCTISEVKVGACSHDYHTEDPSFLVLRSRHTGRDSTTRRDFSIFTDR
jgi:hypothetical protein